MAVEPYFEERFQKYCILCKHEKKCAKLAPKRCNFAMKTAAQLYKIARMLIKHMKLMNTENEGLRDIIIKSKDILESNVRDGIWKEF